MKKTLLFLFLASALCSAASADSTVKVTGVHLCCKSCVTGVEKAIAKVSKATAAVDKDGGSVTISAPDAAIAQQAVDSLVEAGYFGKSEDSAIKLKDTSGAKSDKITSLTVNDVHLCCGKCVTTVQKALGKVKGVTSNTAEKGVKTFQVSGEFTSQEVFSALQETGLTGKVGH